MPEDMTQQRVVVVLGMHRSGTSVMARALKSLGVDLGDDLLPPQLDNPKGYWEHWMFFNANESLLAALGLSWHSLSILPEKAFELEKVKAIELTTLEQIRSHFGTAPLWGFKDPRSARSLPFWQNVFRRLSLTDHYLIAVRNPLSVAKSLEARDGFPGEKSSLLWLTHVLPAIRETYGKPRLVVDYDRFMDAPREQLKRIADRLNLAPPDPEDSFFRDFLDRQLRHACYELNDLERDSRVTALAKEVYAFALGVASDRLDLDSVAAKDQVDRFWFSLTKLAPIFSYLDRLDEALHGLLAQQEEHTRMIQEWEKVIQEQQAWIGELERGKAWLEEQWRCWQESTWGRLGLRLGVLKLSGLSSCESDRCRPHPDEERTER